MIYSVHVLASIRSPSCINESVLEHCSQCCKSSALHSNHNCHSKNLVERSTLRLISVVLLIAIICADFDDGHSEAWWRARDNPE